MLLSDFVDSFWGVDRADFLERFPCPFLLAEANPHEADRGRAVFPLSEAGSGVGLVIGRGERCHVRIKDSLVSTRHAELLPPAQSGGAWNLVDHGSTNRTFVNDEELEAGVPVELKDGARVTFAISSNFVFMDSGSFFDVIEPLRAEREGQPDQDTDVIDPAQEDSATEVLGSAGEVRAAVAGGDPAATAEDLADMSPPEGAPSKDEASTEEGDDPAIIGDVLLFCDTLDPIHLRVGQRLVIGRKAECADIVLASRKVSRKHAEIERRENGWVYVRDLGSSNGAWVGSRKVGPDWCKLRPGRILKIDTYRLRLDLPQLEGSSDGLPTLAPESVTSLAVLPLTDLLAQLEEDERSGVLRIVTPNIKGQIGFNAGAPLYAATSDGFKMEAAILRMLKESEGTCTLFASKRGGASKMTRSFSELVLEEFLTEG